VEHLFELALESISILLAIIIVSALFVGSIAKKFVILLGS
jgi:hypothetical protein